MARSIEKEKRINSSENKPILKEKDSEKECQRKETASEANGPSQNEEERIADEPKTAKSVCLIGKDECMTAAHSTYEIKPIIQKVVIPEVRITEADLEEPIETESVKDKDDEQVEDQDEDHDEYRNTDDDETDEEDRENSDSEMDVEDEDKEEADEALLNGETEFQEESSKKREELNSAKIVKTTVFFIDPAVEDEIQGIILALEEPDCQNREELENRLIELRKRLRRPIEDEMVGIYLIFSFVIVTLSKNHFAGSPCRKSSATTGKQDMGSRTAISSGEIKLIRM